MKDTILYGNILVDGNSRLCLASLVVSTAVIAIVLFRCNDACTRTSSRVFAGTAVRQNSFFVSLGMFEFLKFDKLLDILPTKKNRRSNDCRNRRRRLRRRHAVRFSGRRLSFPVGSLLRSIHRSLCGSIHRPPLLHGGLVSAPSISGGARFTFSASLRASGATDVSHAHGVIFARRLRLWLRALCRRLLGGGSIRGVFLGLDRTFHRGLGLGLGRDLRRGPRRRLHFHFFISTRSRPGGTVVVL
mmetsp:Transcript_11570/g.22425  ORF Transcript_11570/g.22425 Transcript_11570/m.22425 type:complete len:244 (-) Transcript_11570:371-1102(-)